MRNVEEGAFSWELLNMVKIIWEMLSFEGKTFVVKIKRLWKDSTLKDFILFVEYYLKLFWCQVIQP